MQPKLLIIILIVSSFLSSASVANDSKQSNADWFSSLPRPWQVQPADLEKILPEFQARYPDYKERLRAIAEWRIGTPYKIFNLGEEQGPDPDPIFRLDVSDCTSHVLTSMTLAESTSWQEARRHIIDLHYKPGSTGVTKATYAKRWHYTADRIMHHPMTPEISHNYVPRDKMRSVDIILNKKQDGSEFLALDWSLPVTVHYIPNDLITGELLKQLPALVGVAFVKESYFKMGIVMAHEGMLLDGKYLLHAGQSAKETVQEDFMAYYFTGSGPKFDGIMLYDFKPMTN
jgi:hypothetical protein